MYNDIYNERGNALCIKWKQNEWKQLDPMLL
jgi:hypothetical protein